MLSKFGQVSLMSEPSGSAAAPVLKQWDGSMPRSILSDYDLRCLPYSISNYLHHCTGIPQRDCGRQGAICAMCGHAVRLVLQSAEPKIIETAVKRMAGALGHSRIDLDPRCSDD